MELSPGEKRVMLLRAVKYVKALKQRDADYEEACREWAKEGFRPHYCKHGVNQWVDWDPICGQCEDPQSNYELALQFARNDMEEALRRLAWLSYAPDSLPHCDGSRMHQELAKWAWSPIVEEVR